jgi:hypothetical protein
MKHRIIILASALGVLAYAPVSAQQAPESSGLQIGTSDGIVLVTPNSLQLRDYQFRRIETDVTGVSKFVDAANGVNALVDFRDPAGVYITVSEKGHDMQLVAATRNIRSIDIKDAGAPESPMGCNSNTSQLSLNSKSN